ncbi:hypothetical protein [Shewanella frigidimarina]|uniref:hypothetical protein n=1 Tax=Shewanella frigidimarina TaxID=56812 RepID=UPI003D7ADDFA
MIRNKPAKMRGKGCSTEYIFQDKLFKLLESVEGDINNVDIVEQLMMPEIATDKSRNFDLNQSQRMLLSTMFAFADQKGLLTDISINQLKNVTGMTYTRVKSQLKSLCDKNYIHPSYFGGALSEWKTKVNSRYILNWRQFRPTVITIFTSKFLREQSLERLNDGECFMIDQFLKGQATGEYFMWRSVIEDYTGRLLSYYGEDLEQKKCTTFSELNKSFTAVINKPENPSQPSNLADAASKLGLILHSLITSQWEDIPQMHDKTTFHSILGSYDVTGNRLVIIESFGDEINSENCDDIQFFVKKNWGKEEGVAYARTVRECPRWDT